MSSHSSPPAIAPCAPYGTIPYSSYGYRPSLTAGIIFSVCFGLFCASNIYHTFRTRAWWMGVFFSCGTGLETIGWIGRTVAHSCSYSRPINTMQIATLIMGPAYTQSGVYIALWIIVKFLGRGISPVPPKAYLLIIFVVDCVCLSLQAIGGGISGSAFASGKSTATGTTIMVIGIIAQLASGCVFAIFLCIVLPRGATIIKKRENRPLLLTCIAIVISTAMMIMRGFYRSVELCQGWRGRLILDQGYIVGLDAMPMFVAMGTLALLNPCVLLDRMQKKQVAQEAEHGVQVQTVDEEKGQSFEVSPDVEA